MIDRGEIDGEGLRRAVLAPVLLEKFADDEAQEHRAREMPPVLLAQLLEELNLAFGQLRVQTVLTLVAERIGLGAAFETALRRLGKRRGWRQLRQQALVAVLLLAELAGGFELGGELEIVGGRLRRVEAVNLEKFFAAFDVAVAHWLGMFSGCGGSQRGVLRIFGLRGLPLVMLT